MKEFMLLGTLLQPLLERALRGGCVAMSSARGSKIPSALLGAKPVRSEGGEARRSGAET